MIDDLSQYGVLLDPSAPAEGAPVLDLQDGLDVAEVAAILEVLFVTETGLDRIVLVIGGRAVGVSSRRHIAPPTLRGVGDGDGATLPGYSTGYEILRFRCPRCQTVVRRLQVDPREMLSCPEGHGPLELAQ